jgi:hypothetical protein
MLILSPDPVLVRDSHGDTIGTILVIDVIAGEIVIGSLVNPEVQTRFPVQTLAAIDDDRCILPCSGDDLSWSTPNAYIPISEVIDELEYYPM